MHFADLQIYVNVTNCFTYVYKQVMIKGRSHAKKVQVCETPKLHWSFDQTLFKD